MQFWLLKTEPQEYSWQMLQKDKTTKWDGVRNFEARNYMKAMKLGDLAFFYHTGTERRIVGLVEIVKTYYEDPLNINFGIVNVAFKQACTTYLTLSEIKLIPELQNIILLKRGRLSVMPITNVEAMLVCKKTGLIV